MGQPISEIKKAQFLQRAEARLNFARNLPAEDPTRDDKIKLAEKAVQTALASKTAPERQARNKARNNARNTARKKPGR